MSESQERNGPETPPIEMPESKRGKRQGSLDALLANRIKPGEARNPTGTNGWRKAQAKISQFMLEVAEGCKDETRLRKILQAAYDSALIPGKEGAPDRKLLVEQVAGKAKQQVEVTGEDGSPVRIELSTEEKRKLLAAMLTEPNESEPDGLPSGVEGEAPDAK